jgi:mono/diheme cytochrome c family protein
MKTGWPAVAFFVAALLFAAMGSINTSSKASAMDPKSKRLARGEYLTTVMGCGDCHTPGAFYGAPDFKRRLAGSEIGWKGPWGVDYARNLTPDGVTGLGHWSEKEIVTALRTGIAPGGRAIQPPMPWPNMTRLTEEDAYAIAAYLKSIPAVAHRVPDRVAPGQPVAGPLIEFPPPSAWDAPPGSPVGAGGPVPGRPAARK